jgi:hypothetical protein
MSITDEIGGILKQYQTGAMPSPAAVNAHFDQVASAVPSNVLADGLAHAMTSSQTPPLGQIVASLFGQANPAQKAAVLNQLMSALGPAAVAAATGGALSGVLGGALGGAPGPGGTTGTTVSPQQAQQVSPATVTQLADRAQAADGSIVNQLSAFYAQHPALVKGLGVGALALVMSHISNRR